MIGERTERGVSRSRGRQSLRRGDPLPVGSAAIGSGSVEPYRYTMADLERESGLPGRTIRYYITVGLLPPAKGRGVGATYGPVHLLRLKMISRFKDDHLPLEEIKQRLDGLREDDLAAMLQVETAPPEDRWRRVMLHPDLELHVREPGGRPKDYGFEKIVDTIIKQSSILLGQELGERR
jgi:DNA-binding transcriptional MerR regulator